MGTINTIIRNGDTLTPTSADEVTSELNPGVHLVKYNQNTGQVYFEKVKTNYDSIIDLPSKEYEYVVNQMSTFLKPETKAKFQDEGFLYKRSVLLHGLPGTGKSVIVQRVCQEALKKGAIVFFNPEPALLPQVFQILTQTNESRLCVVVFEEFDFIIKNSNTEHTLLSLLDGEIQKNNIMYLATTNYIEQIPARFQRPGRFGSIVEVQFPTAEAREVYLTKKKVNPKMLNEWIKKTEGFSVDELKETVLAVKCLDDTLDNVVNRLNALKAKGEEFHEEKSRLGLDDDDEDNFEASLMKQIVGSYLKPGPYSVAKRRT